jgi:hypothetical protein
MYPPQSSTVDKFQANQTPEASTRRALALAFTAPRTVGDGSIMDPIRMLFFMDVESSMLFLMRSYVHTIIIKHI